MNSTLCKIWNIWYMKMKDYWKKICMYVLKYCMQHNTGINRCRSTSNSLCVCSPPGAGECPGIWAALRPAGEGPAWAGAAAVRPVRPSGGGGDLLGPAGPPQGQAGGRVQQPQKGPGWTGQRPDCGWAGQTGRTWCDLHHRIVSWNWWCPLQRENDRWLALTECYVIK